MSRPITQTVTLAAAQATGIALAQAVGPSLSLALNGALVVAGVAVLDAPRRIIVTSAGNDSAISYVVTGTAGAAQGNAALSETVAGTNAGVAATTQDFATVTGIRATGAPGGNVSAGTNGTGSSSWVVWDGFPSDFQVTCAGFVLAGAPTWSIEYTLDDPFGTWQPAGIPFPRPLLHPTLQGQAGNAQGDFSSTIRASRLTLTAVGSVQLQQQQQGN